MDKSTVVNSQVGENSYDIPGWNADIFQLLGNLQPLFFYVQCKYKALKYN